jgi:BMFP domain-containing protein YqiC
VELQLSFERGFHDLAQELEADVKKAVAAHLSVITNTLDMVRNENVVVESERDPEFRGRVETEVRATMEKVRRLQEIMGRSTRGDGSRVGVEV